MVNDIETNLDILLLNTERMTLKLVYERKDRYTQYISKLYLLDKTSLERQKYIELDYSDLHILHSRLEKYVKLIEEIQDVRESIYHGL